ncbi:MAG TPA: sigma-54 dependent transcriptional regulator [Verrucomicrobiae bacterium]|nr:sigma-54 dependent transcriptional regulator [Verrucomicrobiae bacterium]
MNHVLVVDDEAPMRAALEAHFRNDGWDVKTAYGAGDALAKFRQTPCPLVVTDMRMPDGDGLGVLRGIRQMAPEVAVIFLTAFATVPEAVRAIQEGACDYLVKPVSFPQLKQAAERILASRKPASPDSAGNDLLAGKSSALSALIERACRVARTDTDVLIEAESGTGKELLARLIHQSSGRRTRPLVAVNCAAFPETLLESELFGHARGAFTGALVAKPGKFELAHTGTLLLDEIGEMPLMLQPKLLRTLQEREVDRLGDTKPMRVDVRVIATTNQPLFRLVEQGKFRADLYYRLNVVPLSLPPLRERREDIPALIDHFLDRYASRSRSARPQFSPGLLARLMLHHWPGNIRELENLVRRAVALHPGEAIAPEFFDFAAAPQTGGAAGIAPAASGPGDGFSLREMERKLLESTLEAHGGNRTRAARALGICPRTMRNKVREYGLPPRRYS